MDRKKEKHLLVPENCPPVEYVLIGFTKTDMVLVLGLGFAGAAAGISIYSANGNSILGVMVFFLFTVTAVSVFRRNQYTENLPDMLRILMEYHKIQKCYEYRYVNIWEKVREMRDERRKR